MRIDGLKTRHVKILDELWNCDTMEDLSNYMKHKTPEEISEINVLRELLIIAAIDDDLMSNMNQYPEVDQLMKNLIKG